SRRRGHAGLLQRFLRAPQPLWVMKLTRVITAATRKAAPSTPATTTWTGLMVTMSRSPAALLRTPKKLQNTAARTCRKLPGFGSGLRGGPSLDEGSLAMGQFPGDQSVVATVFLAFTLVDTASTERVKLRVSLGFIAPTPISLWAISSPRSL